MCVYDVPCMCMCVCVCVYMCGCKPFLLQSMIPVYTDAMATFPDYSLQHILSAVFDYSAVGPNFFITLWGLIVNDKNKEKVK